MTRHSHTDSGYNQRRAQCEAAARQLGVGALRDATLDLLEQGRASLDEVVFRRARHVITENERTLAAAVALRRGDTTRFGSLMMASHASLRDDFEVTNEALDVMVECARGRAGCLGARMTGGGFGGSVVALVEVSAAEGFMAAAAACYLEATGVTPTTHLCRPSAGASAARGPRQRYTSLR